MTSIAHTYMHRKQVLHSRALLFGPNPWTHRALELRRRDFVHISLLGATALALGCAPAGPEAPVRPEGVYIPEVFPGEDIFAYIERIMGRFDQTLYRQIVGAANEFKEGDQAAGLAAADDASRDNARILLANTRLSDLRARPLFEDVADKDSPRAILHIIGERPGSGHHAYSVYITAPPASTWAHEGEVNHNITKVVSGIADTALDPAVAAMDTVRILKEMAPPQG